MSFIPGAADETVLGAVLWAVHQQRCVYCGAHLTDLSMMQVDHVIARDVFHGPFSAEARRLYGYAFTSVHDLRNRVPSYGPLHRQKGSCWRPEEIVHLRGSAWRELKVPPPLGARAFEWTADALIHRGLAAAAEKAPIVWAELGKLRIGEGLESFAALSQAAQRDVMRRLGREGPEFPVIPVYQAAGVVRASLPMVEATVYLPRYPEQRGYGLIRFARPAIREALIVPDHAQCMRMLRPGRGLAAPFPVDDGDDQPVQFGPVSLRLRAAERAQLQSLLDAVREPYLAALQAVEVEMLRAARFEYGTRGYRMLRMSPGAWLEMARFAGTAPEGDGPHAPWRLERATQTTLRVIPRHRPAGSPEALAVLTTEWWMPGLPPTGENAETPGVALAWHPNPPRANEIADEDGGPFAPGGLWTAEQVHDWIREALVPRFLAWNHALRAPSGRVDGVVRRIAARFAEPPRHVDPIRLEPALDSGGRGTAREAFTSVDAYRRGIQSLSPRVSPGGGFVRQDAVIGLYIHMSWLLDRFAPDAGQRRSLHARLRTTDTDSPEAAVEALLRDAAAHPPNHPLVQYNLGVLYDLLGMRPAHVDEQEVLEHARRHVYPLFLAAEADAALHAFAGRPW